LLQAFAVRCLSHQDQRTGYQDDCSDSCSKPAVSTLKFSLFAFQALKMLNQSCLRLLHVINIGLPPGGVGPCSVVARDGWYGVGRLRAGGAMNSGPIGSVDGLADDSINLAECVAIELHPITSPQDRVGLDVVRPTARW